MAISPKAATALYIFFFFGRDDVNMGGEELNRFLSFMSKSIMTQQDVFHVFNLMVLSIWVRRGCCPWCWTSLEEPLRPFHSCLLGCNSNWFYSFLTTLAHPPTAGRCDCSFPLLSAHLYISPPMCLWLFHVISVSCFLILWRLPQTFSITQAQTLVHQFQVSAAAVANSRPAVWFTTSD